MSHVPRQRFSDIRDFTVFAVPPRYFRGLVLVRISDMRTDHVRIEEASKEGAVMSLYS